MFWALTRVPWRTILVHGPTILEAARTLYAGAKKPAGQSLPRVRSLDGVDDIRRAVDELEARELQQAALITDLAKQVQDMTTAIEVLRARLQLASIAAGVALAVALVVVVLTLAR